MPSKFATFKYDIGHAITTFGRNLQIIDREYRTREKSKNGKLYTANEKWYRYRCNICGNEEWIYEYCLGDYMKTGCNTCESSPKKIVRGVNDISTTAPWMIKYFVNPEDAYSRTKYSKDSVAMKCPDCGRVYNKKIDAVFTNKTLTCACKDGWSYPNKFMYALLEQIGVKFTAEKSFDWSNNRYYDDYIEHDGKRIITEQHGNQHYDRPIGTGDKHRTVEDERANDRLKYELAMRNGIDYYFVIDSSKSELCHMKNSIINSGLLDILCVSKDDVDWEKCDVFAISNFAKKIAEYKRDNPDTTLHEIADIFNISYGTVLGYVNIGNKYGWCDYRYDDIKTMYRLHKKITNEKPVFCGNTSMYYRSASIAAKELSTDEIKFYPRQIRMSISRGQAYRGFKFYYIDQAEFNRIKTESPNLCVGDYFVLPQGDNNG